MSADKNLLAGFEIRFVKDGRGADGIWRRLARFQETERMTARVMAEREISRSHKENVRKQMGQLAFSLAQAREYFQSAESGGPATRALMAYYGLIALANAEVLWSGDGTCSFDRRDARYNCHGLELMRDADVCNFGVRPDANATGMTGLFGLWRQFATHIPNYSKQTFRYPEGGARNTYNATSEVVALKRIPYQQTPVTLLDCLRHIPAMIPALDAYGEDTKLCRGSIEEEITLDEKESATAVTRIYIMHHVTEMALDDVGSKFRISPRSVPEFSFKRVGSGLAVTWKAAFPVPSEFSLPEIFGNSRDELYFIGDGDHLNEFGYYYYALYIAGMITRYFPHVWIKEFRSNSKASTLIDELVDNALSRVPLLTASALDKLIFLYD
ncbi:YaaC family protein [Rhizobium fabae]|uniref:Uncharacterized protein n=1 Tax=Rhizobium fabae TaxID=573179 RepID=A0A7W6BBB9_9HYPH|nr:hypothetical protein [Rhizobium fabae]MBB3919197.1 hypothetical protein [Rhizobium fabae]RUM16488.1 hypothetical protein EFB14_00095 [Rhizobium fabae]